jgi:hypothetical protein
MTMSSPQFKDVADVQKFLRHGGDEWCLPMVEEYMELIAIDTRPEEIDVEELNGWIENEVLCLEQGYRDWNNEPY